MTNAERLWLACAPSNIPNPEYSVPLDGEYRGFLAELGVIKPVDTPWLY